MMGEAVEATISLAAVAVDPTAALISSKEELMRDWKMEEGDTGLVGAAVELLLLLLPAAPPAAEAREGELI